VGKRRRQARVGVTSGVRAVGVDVLGGTVLGVGSRWLEWAVCGRSVRPERNGGGGAEEQPRAPARRSGELLTSVWSSGQ
jgi:hypothetical protein